MRIHREPIEALGDEEEQFEFAFFGYAEIIAEGQRVRVTLRIVRGLSGSMPRALAR
jgi:hypothetical protein